jgi:hypothetical protein
MRSFQSDRHNHLKHSKQTLEATWIQTRLYMMRLTSRITAPHRHMD